MPKLMIFNYKNIFEPKWHVITIPSTNNEYTCFIKGSDGDRLVP